MELARSCTNIRFSVCSTIFTSRQPATWRRKIPAIEKRRLPEHWKWRWVKHIQHNSRITAAITQVAANKLNIKTDSKCDLGSSHCYPAIVPDKVTDFTTRPPWIFRLFAYCIAERKYCCRRSIDSLKNHIRCLVKSNLVAIQMVGQCRVRRSLIQDQ